MSSAVMIGKSTRPDVAIVHRYFWPQNYPYAVMLRYIAEGMSERGLSVAVYSSHEPGSDHKEQRRKWSSQTGIQTHSLPLWSERSFKVWQKVAQALVYAFWVFFVALTCRARVMWVGTTPPLMMVSVLRFARIFRRFKIVYHCQDIHPEALAINGNINKGKLLNALKFIDFGNVKASDAVITLSEDMKKTLAERSCCAQNVHIINNFILEDIHLKSFRSNENKTLALLFAGSLGRFQNLEFVTQVMIRIAQSNNVNITFMGDGPLRDQMEEKVRAATLKGQIIFTGHRPLAEAIEAMQASDFGIISLTEGVDRVAYPSKTVMYLAAGLPCIAFVDPQSSLGKMIHNNQLGIAVAPNSVENAVSELDSLLQSPRLNVQNKADITDFAQSHFSREVVVRKMTDLVAEMLT